MSTDEPTFDILKDCVAYYVIQASYNKPKKSKTNSAGTEEDLSQQTGEELATELDEFIQYLTQETFDTLPENVKSIESSDLDLSAEGLGTISAPPSFRETVITYSLTTDDNGAEDMFSSILSNFKDELVSMVEDAKRASLPPAHGWKSTRTDTCEICSREVPLTYHHLIPRSMHDKVLKRKWHPQEMLNVVAWLCRRVGFLALFLSD
jgi:hypothetical protein